MNALDNIERTLEEWGQNLRGGTSTQGLQPRDVLHTLLSSLEAERVEGLDHKIYAPNAYTIELHLNEEERSRLLPFLGHEELEASVQHYCQEHKYQFRGPLSLQVMDSGYVGHEAAYSASAGASGAHPATETKKVVVHSRFDVPQNWNADADRTYQAATPIAVPISDHDMDRREIPSAPTRVYRS